MSGLRKKMSNSDQVAEKLDVLADICEHWKRNRERGITPDSIFEALLMLVGEIALMKS